jgi:hypothetical protein
VHSADQTRFRPHHKPVPILRQGRFPRRTDHACCNSQAQCAHNSPPDAASGHDEYGRYGGLTQSSCRFCSAPMC